MAFYKQDIVDINLNTGSIFRSFLAHSIGFKNDDADRFGIRCFRDGEPVDLSGASCQAVFMAPNGVNIALTSYGTVSGNVAYVTLPPACYDYEGQFCLSIQLVGGGVTGTMRIVDGMVVNTGASGTVAPTASVPTYQEILSTYDAMVAATAAANGAIAATYSSSSTYAVGDYCIHDGGLYRCTTAITTGEAWTAAHWTATKIGPDVSELKSAVNSVSEDLYEEKLNIIENKVITSSGTLTDNSEFKATFFYTTSDTFTISLSNLVGTRTARVCAFEAGNFVGVVHEGTYTTSATININYPHKGIMFGLSCLKAATVSITNVSTDIGVIKQLENAESDILKIQDSIKKLDIDDYLKCTISNQTGNNARFVMVIPFSEAITSVDIDADYAHDSSLTTSAIEFSLYLDDKNDLTLRNSAGTIGSKNSFLNDTIQLSKTFTGLSAYPYAKIYVSLSNVTQSQNGSFWFNKLKIKFNGTEINNVVNIGRWSSFTEATLTFEYKINAIPAYAKESEMEQLGVSSASLNVEESNLITPVSFAGSDKAHHGYRQPIQPLKNITGIRWKNMSPCDSGTIHCAILDSSGNVLASKDNTYEKVGESNASIMFVFDSPVSINTAYGFVEISRNDAKINYNELTSSNLNTDVALIPTNSIPAQYKDGASSAWANLNAALSLKFGLIYDVYLNESFTVIDVDKEQNESIKQLQNKCDYIECGPGKEYQKLRYAIQKGCDIGGTVIVYPGTYDLTSEFAEEIENHTTNGILLYNGVHVIFLAGAYVTAILDGTDEWLVYNFAPFQIKGSATIEGAHIRAANTRYCVHDEMQGKGIYTVRYINCDMEMTSDLNPSKFQQCIGGGLGVHGYIEITGGKYKSYKSANESTDTQTISYHNGPGANCDSKIHIRDVYLDGENYFQFGYHGISTHKSPVYISGCSMGKSIVLTNEEAGDSSVNFEITEWNNTVRTN